MLRHRILVLAALALLTWPAAALAQRGSLVMYGGPRVGFSLSPDQLVFGGQVESHELTPRVTFDPDIEVGFGDKESTIAVDADFLYHMTLQGSDWEPFVGAGPTIY